MPSFHIYANWHQPHIDQKLSILPKTKSLKFILWFETQVNGIWLHASMIIHRSFGSLPILIDCKRQNKDKKIQQISIFQFDKCDSSCNCPIQRSPYVSIWRLKFTFKSVITFIDIGIDQSVNTNEPPEYNLIVL